MESFQSPVDGRATDCACLQIATRRRARRDCPAGTCPCEACSRRIQDEELEFAAPPPGRGSNRQRACPQTIVIESAAATRETARAQPASNNGTQDGGYTGR